jgi:hypothetical protein
VVVNMPRTTIAVFWMGLSVLPCGFAVEARAQQPAVEQGSGRGIPEARISGVAAPLLQSDQRLPGNITGTVVDQSGAPVAGARVSLSGEEQSPNQEAVSGDEGQFSFTSIAPGPFQLTVTLEGFTTQASTGILRPGESCLVPMLVLAVASARTEVRVTPTRIELAEDQIKLQEKQRVLGVVPNFYVSYLPNALPLSSRQKFELAWKTVVDPVSFGVNGAVAGIQQAQHDFSGYGQGAQGYGKRYGASFGDFAAATFIGGAILPSLLKQDPRYFYKGSGSKRSRILYALANSVICKADDGHWEANYSSILGSVGAGGLSNLYYPAKDRNGAALTFENALIGIGESAAVNLLQEFFVRKLTPNASNHEPGGP